MAAQSHVDVAGGDSLLADDPQHTQCIATAEAQRTLGDPICRCGHAKHKAGKCQQRVGAADEPDFLWVRCKCAETK